MVSFQKTNFMERRKKKKNFLGSWNKELLDKTQLCIFCIIHGCSSHQARARC